jgi:hypothetical protein
MGLADRRTAADLRLALAATRGVRDIGIDEKSPNPHSGEPLYRWCFAAGVVCIVCIVQAKSAVVMSR